jgi:hypothetical protein
MARFHFLHGSAIMTAEKSERTWQRVVRWSGIAVALIVVIFLATGSLPRKWDVAMMWTSTTLAWVLIFGRIRSWERNYSWRFLAFGAICLVLHTVAMWLIFGKPLPRLIPGTMYVVPVAFIEAILLTVVFSAIEHNSKQFEHRRLKT